MIVRVVLAMLGACTIWAQSTVVLSGRITDAATGQPIEGAAVALNAIHTSYSDASGNYSFDEAVPGTAQIAIRADGYVAFEKTNPDEASIQIPAGRSERNFRLTPAASISGRIAIDDAGMIRRSIIVKVLQEVFTDGVRRFAADKEARAGVSAVDDEGNFRISGLEPARYLISVGPPTGGTSFLVRNPDAARVLEGLVPTYYPGTTEFAAAIPVSLRAGENRTTDFKVEKRKLFRASGEIESAATESRKATVEVSTTGEGLSYTYGGAASSPGTFVVDGLPPGQYAVTRVIIPGESIPNASGSGFSFSMSWREVNLPFAVTDHDVEGLKLVTLPAVKPLGAEGSFRMANAGMQLPADLAVQFSFPEPGGQSDAIPAAPNGSFWLTGPSGDYSVRPIVPAGYAVTEIRYGGANYLNSLIPMRGDTLDSSLIVVLNDQPGSVTGSLVDGDQKPVAAKIVLAPEPLPSGFDFRAFRVASVDSQGAFAMGGLPPGRYKAVALTGDDRKRDHDLAILGDKLRLADAFEVSAGQSVTITPRP